MNEKEGKILLGYIINEKKPLSIFAPHRFLFESRHWYTITCIRWVNFRLESNLENVNQEDIAGFSKNCWVLIDSHVDKIHRFVSELDVDDYLSRNLQDHCNIFQAWLQL